MSQVPPVRGQRAPHARSHRACTTCKLVARGAPARCYCSAHPPRAVPPCARARAARREPRVARPIAHCAAVPHPAATHHVLSSLHVERSPHLPGEVGGWRDAHRSCMLADGRVLARHATRSHAAHPHTARAHPPLLARTSWHLFRHAHQPSPARAARASPCHACRASRRAPRLAPQHSACTRNRLFTQNPNAFCTMFCAKVIVVTRTLCKTRT